MKVLIIGPGALGCLLATKLSSGHEVWLLDHDPARATFLEGSGLVLEEGGEKSHHSVRATAEAAKVGAVDLALLCVKSLKVEEAVIRAQPALRRAKLFLALQNGINHLEVLPELCRSTCWGVGATAHGATLVGPGQVLHRGFGATQIGLWPARPLVDEACQPAACGQALRQVAEVMTEAGIYTEAVTDILPCLWNKLLVNLGINALTAINGCPNGALLDDPVLAGTMAAAVREGAMVAGKLGVNISHDPLAVTREVCRATATNISSMLQDIRAGRPTEIEAINGAVLRLARGLGVSVPVNEELVRQVQELERNYHVFC